MSGPNPNPPDLAGERLNAEPAVFRGYTDSELMSAVGLAAFAGLPAGGVVGFVMGSFPMAMGVTFLAMLGLVVLGATVFQAWKRNRPEFYLEQRVRLWLAERGLAATPLVRHRGVMGLGRDFYGHPARRRRRIGAGAGRRR